MSLKGKRLQTKYENGDLEECNGVADDGPERDFADTFGKWKRC